MKSEIQSALDALYQAYRTHGHDNLVSVDVFINCQGLTVTENTRDYDSLKRDNISMRNVSGEFIAEKEE